MYCLVRFSLTLLLVWDSWIVINNLARKFFRGTTRRCIQVREDLRGEGNGVASVTLFTFTLKLGAHADTACVKLGPHADIADTACVKLGSHAHTACVKPLPPC